MTNTVDQPLSRPELLAPAGDHDCLRAAVENGADAIYFGLESGFNARARATNFHLDNVHEIMDELHRRCVKGYVTLNTLAFTDELPRMENVIRRLADGNVDAVLVQDLGVARLVRNICSQLEIHASTQMTLSSAECIDEVASLGIKRVVLPRELSIKEIRRIKDATDMPLEAFVHGALCVAYSGQCLTSESLGGRSANRGQCAQACRLPYDLVCDGQEVELGDQKYLLSPQDLGAFDLTKELIEAGICSFKIEGRLKTAEYVANTVQHYRSAIDSVLQGREVTFSRSEVNDLEMSFSRGLSPGWLEGCDHKMLVPALSSAKRGVLLGEVVAVEGAEVRVRLEGSIVAGDGVVFEGDRLKNEEQGGRVYEVFRNGELQEASVDGGIVSLTFDRNSVDAGGLYAGQKLWKTDDPRLNKRLRASFETQDVTRRVNVDFVVSAEAGSPLNIQATAQNGAVAEVTSEAPLEVARKHPLTAETLREQLGRLGATVFQLNNVAAKIGGGPMVPLSVLGKLRRSLIEQLQTSDLAFDRTVSKTCVLPQLRAAALAVQHSKTEQGRTSLNVLCRSLSQLQAAAKIENPPDVIYADFADIREYAEAVQIGRECNVSVFPATPRIQKPGEMGIFKAMLKHAPAGVLIRNLAGLAFFRNNNVPVVADFSLNVTNELTAAWLMDRGVERVTVSYDLNRDQMLDMVDVVPPAWLEIVIHQHMPMFHMEHCVFCSVLSPGTNKTNCGRPCDFHKVELTDRIGMKHPLTADVGCRNTLFNATPQSSAEVVAALKQRQIRSFRVELLNQSDSETEDAIRLYQDLLNGTVTADTVWSTLQASNRVGVTRGTLEERRNPLAIL